MSTGAAAAARTARAVSSLGASFMSDPAMTNRGRDLGFEGADFYFAGRAGAVGEIDADVATAVLVFFHRDVVRPAWSRSAALMPRRSAAEAFASCAAEWAVGHLGDGVDWETLSTLTRRMVDAADLALAPIVAGWRSLPEPTGARSRTVHLMNALREYRMARHAVALVAHGVSPGDAVRHRQPAMLSMFGWAAGEVSPEVLQRWQAAEAMTDALVGGAYDALDSDELDLFVALTHAAAATIH